MYSLENAKNDRCVTLQPNDKIIFKFLLMCFVIVQDVRCYSFDISIDYKTDFLFVVSFLQVNTLV